MAKKNAAASAQRLLEAWVPPADAGEPVGCVATTFTFDPLFFEEHCLSRFLRLETDPREDGAAYLIEREDKLAQTTVAVLVDRSMADGSASPRWGVLPVTIPTGIQHAKISILGWHNVIRILVGSANLTEAAYRKNQEVFGVVDFRDGGEVPFEVLDAILGFVEGLAEFAPGSAAEPGPKVRLSTLITGLRSRAHRWTVGPRRGGWPQVVPMLLGPMQLVTGAIPERLGRLLRDRGGPAHSASVLSPFFDKASESSYAPTLALVAALTERGNRRLEFLVPADSLPDGKLRFRAPRSLVKPGRQSTEVDVYPVRDEADGEVRPLHTKAIWLWNDRWHVFMMGSSNFTTAGLGLHDRARNAEANLAYVFPEDTKLVRTIESSLPEWEDAVENPEAALWEPIEEDEGEAGSGEAPLPSGFHEALFDIVDGKGLVTLRFGAKLPPKWSVTGRGGVPPVYVSELWTAAGGPDTADVAWSTPLIPTVFEVRWWDTQDATHAAPWPVNVRDLARLPPPDELRNLSLETLVEILGSRLPLHEAVTRARRRAEATAGAPGDGMPIELDPHRRVRTETFLLQRARRVAKAVEQLVENLNRPVVHRDALAWRLQGPVGPIALARALVEAAQSPGEAAFLLAEVALALRRVDVKKVAVGVDVKEVRHAVQAVRIEIDERARRYLADGAMPKRMADYIEQALAEAGR
jgi:hypothetical protein